MRAFLLRFALLSSCIAFTQCVDTSPLPFAADSGAATPDAGNADAALIQSCRHCLADEGAPCRSQYDSCEKLTKCPPVLNCLIDKGCFEFESIQTRIQCGLPCLEAEGVLAGNDPVTTALGQINLCVVTSCSDACFMKK